MTDQGERYDRLATGYAQWWAPVIAPTAVALLDRVAGDVDAATGGRLLDVGTGTGTLAVAALQRWPAIELDAIDASAGMVAVARATLAERLDPSSRWSVTTAFADRLPYDEGTFDVAISSFVLQLVPNRHRALREIRRVLRPGGRLAYVTWVVDRGGWRADDILDDVLDDLGVGAREEEGADDGRAGDLASVESGAAELRRAGFRQVTAEAARLRHRFDPDSYVGFIAEFDEQDLVASFEPDLRERFVAELTARLERLVRRDPDALVLDAPVAYVTGTRPAR